MARILTATDLFRKISIVVKLGSQVAEAPVIHVYAFNLGIDAAPAVEDPYGVGLVGCKSCRFIGDIIRE